MVGVAANSGLRVLHLVPAHPFGGAQRVAIDLARLQRATGVEAELLFTNAGVEGIAAAREAAVPVQSIGTGLSRLGATRRAATSADIVHLHVPPPWIPTALPAWPAIVAHLHVCPTLQSHAPTPRRKLDALAERVVLSRAHCLIAVSKWIETAWRTAYPRVRTPCRVVVNGTVLPQLRQRKSGPFTIAMASRLVDRKGVEEFIAIAEQIHRKAPDIVFRIAGEGPMRASYEAAVRNAGLSAVLTFEGFVSDMAAFWACADLAAFTPPFEPFGLRLIEPVAHGVPVLAYTNGSGSDEVISLCRGVETAPYPNAEALSIKALMLRADSDRRVRMSAEGREDIAAHFSLQGMAQGVASVYQAVAKRRVAGV